MQLATIFLVIGLMFVATTSSSDTADNKEGAFVPPLELRSCIPLYCRKSCKQQRYLEGFCSEEKLCTCRHDIKELSSRIKEQKP